MKIPTIAVIPALLVLCVGMAIGQDAAHDVDKAATKTGHAVKHATKKVGNATKIAPKTLAMEPRSRPMTPEKVSRPVQKRPAMALRMRLTSSERFDR